MKFIDNETKLGNLYREKGELLRAKRYKGSIFTAWNTEVTFSFAGCLEQPITLRVSEEDIDSMIENREKAIEKMEIDMEIKRMEDNFKNNYG